MCVATMILLTRGRRKHRVYHDKRAAGYATDMATWLSRTAAHLSFVGGQRAPAWSALFSALILSWSPTVAAAQSSARDSLTYIIHQESRFKVETRKAGLLGFLGHEHVVRARAFSGRIVYYPEAPLRSRVEITVLSDSLEILTNADTSDLRKMTEVMRTEVLKVEQYPTITFVSRSVAATDHGLRVDGALTMVGETREITFDVTVDANAYTFRTAGTFSVKQTDFGIKPYSAASGMVKVADEVTFHFDVLATLALEYPEPAPQRAQNDGPGSRTWYARGSGDDRAQLGLPRCGRRWCAE